MQNKDQQQKNNEMLDEDEEYYDDDDEVDDDEDEDDFMDIANTTKVRPNLTAAPLTAQAISNNNNTQSPKNVTANATRNNNNFDEGKWHWSPVWNTTTFDRGVE